MLPCSLGGRRSSPVAVVGTSAVKSPEEVKGWFKPGPRTAGALPSMLSADDGSSRWRSAAGEKNSAWCWRSWWKAICRYGLLVTVLWPDITLDAIPMAGLTFADEEV